ncbi:uncharacterized protein LOC125664868 [Ostrea edulis]|uniref:uncharacterized protein LOC125664868 n=1 Tax=Ostrea edulis TaxID=37623 RepID=UPI002095D186|nr:uncharacterized protein LOC125664868 [Ostrea edulis]
MSKSLYIYIPLIVLIGCLWNTDGIPRSKKTFVPINIEPDEWSNYGFLYQKHFMAMKKGGYRHRPVTCWMYNTTVEEIPLVHSQDGLKLVELKVMQLASSQVGRVLNFQEAHTALMSIDRHIAVFCHSSANTTTVIWLEAV